MTWMSTPSSADLQGRLVALGRELGERERSHAQALERAREHAEALRRVVSDGLEAFQRAAAEAGAPHLQIALGEVRSDDKHLRAVQFDLARGRHRAIVTVKSRGEVTLVGPFHAGKNEGPCETFPVDAEAELGAALAAFLERFLAEAATP
jgi:hypothetical protein